MTLLAEAIQEHFKSGGQTETPKEENTNVEATVDNNVEAKTETTPVVEDSIEFISNDKPVEEIVPTENTNDSDNIPSEFVLDEEPTLDISKYTDGEFKNIDDLVNSYKELKSNTVENTNVLEMLDAQTNEKYGLNYAELVMLKNIDYNSMDDFDILAEYEEFKDPEIPQEEIDAELEEFSILRKSKEEVSQMIEDGDITDREYKMISAKFSKKVRQAKAELTDFQNGLSLEDIKISTQAKTEKPRQLTQEEVMAQKESMRNDLKSFGKLRINLGNKDGRQDFDFDVTDDDKSSLVDTVSNPNWILDRWTEKDGSTNKNKAYRDAYVLMNFNKMIKAAYNEGVVNGSKKHVVNEDNITLGGGKAIQNNSAVDPLQSLADKMGTYL